MPGVSAIIPVRNGANYLVEAIESCLQQTLPVQEIFAVDDGSTDGTAEIAARFGGRVNCIRQEWSGVATALNNGIASATGEYLAFLDHDDLWVPEKNALQLKRMQHEPALEAVFGHVQQFISPELLSDLSGRVRVPGEPQAGIQISAMLLRRSAWERIGRFEGGKDAFTFVSWYASAIENNLKTAMLPNVVSKRRIHTSNYVRTQRETLHDRLLDIMRQKAARARRGNPPPG